MAPHIQWANHGSHRNKILSLWSLYSQFPWLGVNCLKRFHSNIKYLQGMKWNQKYSLINTYTGLRRKDTNHRPLRGRKFTDQKSHRRAVGNIVCSYMSFEYVFLMYSFTFKCTVKQAITVMKLSGFSACRNGFWNCVTNSKLCYILVYYIQWISFTYIILH